MEKADEKKISTEEETQKKTIKISTAEETSKKTTKKDYTKILNVLEATPKYVMTKILPLMKDIEQNGEIVKQSAYVTKKDQKIIKEWLEIKTLNLIEDSEKVNDEIIKFKNNLLGGEEKLEKNSDEYPFLAQVWYGDMFDGKIEIDALNFLVSELQITLKNCNEDFLVKECITNFQ
jgi:hypothetical protein